METYEYLHAVTAVLIVCINVPLLYVLYKDSTLRSVMFLWVAGLVMVDLSTGLLAIPVSFVILADLDALSGAMIPVCLFLNGLRMLTKQVALLGLLFITLDRFVAIRYPFYYNAHMSSRKVVIALVMAWTMGLLVVELPLMGWNNGWTAKTRCSGVHIFQRVFAREYRIYMKMALFMMLPMLVICVVYGYLWLVIRKHSRQIRDQPQDQGSQTNRRHEVQAAKRFALYSLVFVICLFPVEIMGSVELLVNVRANPWFRTWVKIKNVAIIISYWISVFNPLLYVGTNRTFQVSIVKYLPCLRLILRNVDTAARSDSTRNIGGNAVLAVTTNTTNTQHRQRLGSGNRSDNLGHSSDKPPQGHGHNGVKGQGDNLEQGQGHGLDSVSDQKHGKFVDKTETNFHETLQFDQMDSTVDFFGDRKSSSSDNDVDIDDFEAINSKQLEQKPSRNLCDYPDTDVIHLNEQRNLGKYGPAVDLPGTASTDLVTNLSVTDHKSEDLGDKRCSQHFTGREFTEKGNSNLSVQNNDPTMRELNLSDMVDEESSTHSTNQCKQQMSRDASTVPNLEDANPTSITDFHTDNVRSALATVADAGIFHVAINGIARNGK